MNRFLLPAISGSFILLGAYLLEGVKGVGFGMIACGVLLIVFSPFFFVEEK